MTDTPKYRFLKFTAEIVLRVPNNSPNDYEAYALWRKQLKDFDENEEEPQPHVWNFFRETLIRHSYSPDGPWLRKTWHGEIQESQRGK